MVLGYSIRDIVDMQIAINEATYYVPAEDGTKADLYKAFDFLQGLLVEGHVL
jgi:hypothetical protein